MYIHDCKGEENANIGFHSKPSISPLFSVIHQETLASR